MNSNIIVLLPILLPVVSGILILTRLQWKEEVRNQFISLILILNGLFTLCIVLQSSTQLVIWNITETIPIFLSVDALGKLFAVLVSIIWICVGFYSFEYLKHEQNKERFLGCFLIILGVLIGVAFSGNIITFYLFYELMTLAVVPLVFHSLQKEAMEAALKYLFYSIAGASMVLFGVISFYQYSTTLTFIPGGTLNIEQVKGHETILLISVFIVIIGFATKAGMFPMHGWLPMAHPVAPAPASAILSGIVVKTGVFGIIRIIFYLIGPDFIRGTWVQTTFLILTLITVFIGSMLAFKEKGLKKRLAYSTISQISYILFGISLLNAEGLLGSLLHFIFHCLIKNALFLIAGAIIYKTNKTKVSELKAIGKEMPITMWCFTLVSLSLVGIPLTSGFISKWYLAIGSLHTKIPLWSWLGPVVLLLSALLTAGYLLGISADSLFAANSKEMKIEKKEVTSFMIVPIIILTIGAICFGIYQTPLIQFLSQIVEGVL